MYKVLISPQAQDSLIDKGLKYQLDQKQRNKIIDLLQNLKKNPYCGEKRQYGFEIIKTNYFIEEYIGKKLFITLHYDIENIHKTISVVIKAISIHYKM